MLLLVLALPAFAGDDVRFAEHQLLGSAGYTVDTVAGYKIFKGSLIWEPNCYLSDVFIMTYVVKMRCSDRKRFATLPAFSKRCRDLLIESPISGSEDGL